MKKCILVLVSMMMSVSAFAEVKIAVIDMQKALQSVSAGKAAKKKIEAEFKKKQQKFKKQEKSLMKMKTDLEKKALAYTEDQKRKKAMEFNQKMMAFREEVGRSQQAIGARERELTLPIIQELRKQIEVIAKKKNYSVVLERSEQSVMFVQKKYDITSELVKAFEKNWKKKK